MLRSGGRSHALGDPDRLSCAVDTWADDNELVTADAADSVALARCSTKAVGRFGQEPVTGRVAESVVDRLEMIKVDEDEGVSSSLLSPYPRQRGR